jgi:ATP-binding cassette, subfamily B, bacterial
MADSSSDALLRRRYRHPAAVLYALYRDEGRWLLLALIPYLIKSSPVWLMPILTAAMIDIVTDPQHHTLETLWLYAGLIVVLIVQNVPMNMLFARCLSIATRNIEQRLRAALVTRLQQLSMDFYRRTSTGALQSKLLRDVELIQQLTQQLYDNLLYGLISIMVAIFVTALRVPWFLVFFLLTIPVTVALMRLMRRPLQHQNEHFRGEIELLSGRLSEMLRLIPITRAHGLEQDEIDGIRKQLDSVRAAGMRLDAVNAVFGATSWVTFRFFDALCLIVACTVVFTRLLPITVGDVVMLTGFFSNMTGAVLMLVNLLPQTSKGLESIRSIGEVLESPDMERNAGKRPVEKVQGTIQFEHVSFTYPDSTDASLVDLHLEVEAGETIALVGASGAGKSTVLNLIIGFIRPSSGHIFLDGVDMETLDLSTYRRFLSVVPQETVLFQGTIRENILYGTHHLSEEVFRQALLDSNVDEFIRQLPEREHTLIGEYGARLSGGQRQRIAIARALVRNPRVLLLDEATSALDTASERLIQQALQRLLSGRTTFVVAHRLSTIQHAHRILVLEQGKLVEVGSHDQLVAQSGRYTTMLGSIS